MEWKFYVTAALSASKPGCGTTAMRYDDFRRSDDVEDRRDDSGGGICGGGGVRRPDGGGGGGRGDHLFSGPVGWALCLAPPVFFRWGGNCHVRTPRAAPHHA